MKTPAATLALWLSLPLLETLAQVAVKLGGRAFAALPLGWPWLLGVVTSPMILLSFACDALTFLLWMRILSRHRLSFAFPITSLCYVTITASGWCMFGEAMTLLEIVGIVLIVSGVTLVAGERETP